MNIKIIILLIGTFLFTIGFINHYKFNIDKKNIYKILPRNVYDEIYFSLPMLEYEKDLYNSINPSYILDDENNYNSLFEQPIKKCKDNSYEECEIYNDFSPGDNINKFNIIDKDNDGFITRDELLNIGLSQSQVNDIIATSDTDGDGRLSMDEFNTMSSKRQSRYIKNMRLENIKFTSNYQFQ